MTAIAKYKKWLEPDRLAMLKGMARDGLSEKQIAYNLGISDRTLMRWKKEYPEIAEALQCGKDAADYMVEEALFQSGTGYYATDTTVKTNRKGEVTTTEKRRYVDQKPAAAIFWLKHRRPDKWGDQQEKKKQEKTDQIDFSGMHRFVRWVLNPENTMPYDEYTEDEETAKNWNMADAAAALWKNHT